MAQYKLVIILGLVTLIITTMIAFHVSATNSAYDAGYDKAISEMQAKFMRDLEEKMKHKEEILNNAILESNKWKKEAIRLQGIEPVTVTETEVVEIVKTNIDCKRITGISKLLNKLTEANFTD